MPAILQSRLALLAMIGALLIPVGMSTLGGLTHVLTCDQQTNTPLSLMVPNKGAPVLTTSTRISEGESTSLCGGLTLNMGARVRRTGDIALVLPISNESAFAWRGTVKLLLGKTPIPVNIGEIGAGETASDTISVRLGPGTHQVTGSLLIGP
jgi:hypothetical protein